MVLPVIGQNLRSADVMVAEKVCVQAPFMLRSLGSQGCFRQLQFVLFQCVEVFSKFMFYAGSMRHTQLQDYPPIFAQAGKLNNFEGGNHRLDMQHVKFMSSGFFCNTLELEMQDQMAEAASLIEKYRVDGGPSCELLSPSSPGGDLSKAAEIHQSILSFKPDWESYEALFTASSFFVSRPQKPKRTS